MLLPNSPVRKIHQCPKCGDVSLKFYDPEHDRVLTKEEWQDILAEGKEALDKILKPLKENPTFFIE
tara:strand:- start:1109 stop:1306 length:198 start_codon:yes stop_codon:yes gene_type:complete